uniref:EEF1A lysine methyltransferase 2 n=1 Tax=Sinocyclocheilus grahami TaxID=75366 RepID=A0A672RBC8_SINGR
MLHLYLLIKRWGCFEYFQCNQTLDLLLIQCFSLKLGWLADFLNPSAELKGFDVCIDKGTFDAISLSPEDREEAKKCYVNSLKTVMQPEGFFIITSCNWTKEQLLQIFTPGFELFGGVTGNSVTALGSIELHLILTLWPFLHRSYKVDV